MRTELMQMDWMALDERLGAEAGEVARKQKDIRRRMRRERLRMETELRGAEAWHGEATRRHSLAGR